MHVHLPAMVDCSRSFNTTHPVASGTVVTTDGEAASVSCGGVDLSAMQSLLGSSALGVGGKVSKSMDDSDGDN